MEKLAPSQPAHQIMQAISSQTRATLATHLHHLNRTLL